MGREAVIQILPCFVMMTHVCFDEQVIENSITIFMTNIKHAFANFEFIYIICIYYTC